MLIAVSGNPMDGNLLIEDMLGPTYQTYFGSQKRTQDEAAKYVGECVESFIALYGNLSPDEAYS